VTQSAAAPGDTNPSDATEYSFSKLMLRMLYDGDIKVTIPTSEHYDMYRTLSFVIICMSYKLLKWPGFLADRVQLLREESVSAL